MSAGIAPCPGVLLDSLQFAAAATDLSGSEVRRPGKLATLFEPWDRPASAAPATSTFGVNAGRHGRRLRSAPEKDILPACWPRSANLYRETRSRNCYGAPPRPLGPPGPASF